MLPDWLMIELRARWERFQDRVGLLTLRRWINEYPTVTQAIAGASAMLLLAVVIWLLLPGAPPPRASCSSPRRGWSRRSRRLPDLFPMASRPAFGLMS
jgi:hypothetical protein